MRRFRRGAFLNSPALYGAAGGGGGAMTWNPADRSSTDMALSNGNLTALHNANFQWDAARATAAGTGKFYFEWVLDVDFFGNIGVGVANLSCSLTADLVGQASSDGATYSASGYRAYSGNKGTFVAMTNGDVCMVACDGPNALIWFGVNGTWIDTGDPATGTNGLSIPGVGTYYPVVSSFRSTPQITARFTAGSFSYGVPSGFAAIS